MSHIMGGRYERRCLPQKGKLDGNYIVLIDSDDKKKWGVRSTISKRNFTVEGGEGIVGHSGWGRGYTLRVLGHKRLHDDRTSMRSLL